MKRIGIPLIFSLLFLLLLIGYQSGKYLDKNLHIVMCDVGQGDAIYIRTPGGADVLIDGGPGQNVMECLAAHMPFWDREIDLVFATHPDADHITGLVSVLKSYRVGSFNTISAKKDTRIFEELKQLIAQTNTPYKELTLGAKFGFSDGVAITTLWPVKNYENEDSNDHSLVKLLTYKEFDVLLTGDISYQILNSLPIDGNDIEIFKVPHHGSKTGVDAATVAKIRAEIALISAGANNSYNHPHPSVISLLKKASVPYLETSKEGSIEIVSNGQSFRVVE